jgi:hypothetical protein
MAKKTNRRKQLGAALTAGLLMAQGAVANDAIVTSEIDEEIANYRYTDSQSVANAFDKGFILAQSESDAIDAFWMFTEAESLPPGDIEYAIETVMQCFGIEYYDAKLKMGNTKLANGANAVDELIDECAAAMGEYMN